jgi:imidazolonepropionase-like amidohydrolase
LTGTDTAAIPCILPGISIHDELSELVGAGLSPYEALKVSTTNAHEFLGELGTAGTVELGKRADLVLLDGNPLENISNTRKIIGVMTQNRWIPRAEIDKRLNEIRHSYAKIKNNKTVVSNTPSSH